MGLRHAIKSSSRALAGVWLASAVVPQVLPAQVGLSSRVARVELLAQVAPRVDLIEAGPVREQAHAGRVREVSTTLRLSANTGYRLIVRGPLQAGLRIWVQNATGNFQALGPGSLVVVDHSPRAPGELVREIRYRIESSEGSLEPLPVRYEIAVDPLL